ncbi:MAG: LysM peptidoglycan-binding domain-containing protein [Candidatus Amesbacteria bacterium]|nr:LysM peptidoglycan-binding domain-containing protein [Candidatus Amesbacteria bacterium]
MKDFLKKFKLNFALNEQTMSMILGAVVVLLVGGLLFNYLKTAKNPSVNDQANVSSSATEAAKLTTETTVTAGVNEYVVKAGDSLWKIAEQETGSGYNWTKLYELNKSTLGKNPNLIYSGTKLVLK